MQHDATRCGGRTWRTAVAWILLGSAVAGAQTPSATPTAESAGTNAANAATQPESSYREQTIYIPYTKLRETFEREGRGVFLPYGEFEKLWRAAREKAGPEPQPHPPTPFLVSEVNHEATVSKDVVTVAAEVKLDLLTDGWLRIPLGLADAAITRAAMDGRPARVVLEPGSGYQLLIHKQSPGAESVVLSLEYAKAYEKSAGRNNVSFQPPQAPISRWLIRIPNAGAKVDISPLIAASEVPGTEGTATRPSDETTVLAFVGGAPTVQIAWTPRAEGATGLTSLATVQTEQQVRIEDGVMRTQARLSYEISRAALSELIVDVPADQRVINVLDANVRQWSIAAPTASASAPAGEGRQRIHVQLFQPALAAQNIVVELERFISEIQLGKLSLPDVAAVGAARQQGVIVVATGEGLTAEVGSRTGLSQVDTGELPQTLAATPWLLSYRYASVPFELTLQVTRVQPRVTAESLVEATLEPEGLTFDVLTLYTIERAGLFRLEFEIPAGYDIRKVAGLTVAEAQPVVVDAYHLDGDDKRRLIVNLANKALGRVAVVLSMERPLAETDLLSPTGRSVSLPLDVPRPAAATVERATGRLVINAVESLRVNPGESKGVRSVSFKEAFEGLTSIRDKSAAKPVLAFTYAQEAAEVQLLVERRKPQVTVRQLLLAQIEPGVVKYSATFTYDILYSGVPSVRIDLPADVAAEIRNNTPDIREKPIDPPPDDVAPGQVAWSFAGETELAGTVQIRLGWEKKLEELAVGKTIEMNLPQLSPKGADRAWGQIVWTKAETLDVHETGEPKGVRPIDPQHDLQPGAAVAGAARALEFHDAWDLSVAVTRYQLEEVKRSSIERAVLQMAAGRSGQVSVRGLYRLRTAGQRLAIKLPGGVQFDSEPLRINGKAVALERGDANTFFVPLVGLTANAPALLEVRYSLPDAADRFVPPLFPDSPAVQKVYLCAYLPEDYTWLGSKGPWTSEMTWQGSTLATLAPVPRQSAAQLLGWVRDGLNLPADAADTFQTDGRPHLFSALNPTSGGDGTLRLIGMDTTWLNAVTLGLLAIIGLILIRFKATVRCTAAGTLAVLLILSGVFLPTFSRQILSNGLVAAVAAVLVVWSVHYLVWIRPRDPFIVACKQARQQRTLDRLRAQQATPAPSTPVPSSNPESSETGGQAHV